MTPFFFHSTTQSQYGENASTILSAYILSDSVSEPEFDSALAKEITLGLNYDEITFICLKAADTLVMDWIKNPDSSVRGRLEKCVASIESSIVITYHAETKSHIAKKINGIPLSDDESKRICISERRASLMSIFEARSGLVQAPKGFHYIKPSKKHSSSFIRASNVLEHYAATPILAFWVLPFLSNIKASHVIVDTSSIAAVAYAAAYYYLYYHKDANFPLIASHESYGGLDRLRVSVPDHTVILISASTSGGLQKDLEKKGAIAKNIVFLFFLSEGASNVNVLCNLKRENEETMGIKPIENFPADSCSLCKNKSYAVSLVGDQFAFEPPAVEEILIAKSDLSSQILQDFEELGGLELFCLHRKVGERISEIGINAKSLFCDVAKFPPTIERLKKIKLEWGDILQSLPQRFKKIVHTSYPGSDALAADLRGLIEPKLNHHIDILDINSLENTSPENGVGVIIVSSYLEDPSEFNQINLLLRKIHKEGEAIYLTMAFAFSDENTKKRIKSNLTWGSKGANTFKFFNLIDLYFPLGPEADSWSKELDLLHEFEQWAETNGHEFPQQMARRIETLVDAPSQGLVNDAFWLDRFENPLTIRPNFVFLNSNANTRKLTQADIFVLISAFLNSLRLGESGKPKLIYKPYARALISPENFVRLSDGIIQSSILRAARGFELCYASDSDPRLSARMTEVLKSMISRDQEDEALIEFIIALGTKQMTLYPEHLFEVLNSISNSFQPNYIKLLSASLIEELVNRTKVE